MTLSSSNARSTRSNSNTHNTNPTKLASGRFFSGFLDPRVTSSRKGFIVFVAVAEHEKEEKKES